MGRFRSKLDVLRQTYRLCRLGGMPEPPWLEPFLRMNAARELDGGGSGGAGGSRAARAPRAAPPENRLIQSYYDRHPFARLQPIDLQSFEPPPVRKLAARQLARMQAGAPRRQAQREVEQEMLASGELSHPKRPSVIRQIQAEEERVLMAAIQQRKEAGGKRR